MFTECREAGFPEPVFEYEQTGLWVTFPFASEIVALTSEGGETKTTQKTTQKTREKILRLVRENPQVSMDELASALGITRWGVVWHVRRLKTEGLLKRVGPDRGGHWEVLG